MDGILKCAPFCVPSIFSQSDVCAIDPFILPPERPLNYSKDELEKDPNLPSGWKSRRQGTAPPFWKGKSRTHAVAGGGFRFLNAKEAEEKKGRGNNLWTSPQAQGLGPQLSLAVGAHSRGLIRGCLGSVRCQVPAPSPPRLLPPSLPSFQLFLPCRSHPSL